MRIAIVAALTLAACSPKGGVSVGDGLDCGGKTADSCAEALPLGYPCSTGDSCADGLYCRPLGGAGVCASQCSADDDCAPGQVCAEDKCAWNIGTVGSPCPSDAPCHARLECVSLDDVSYCTRTCDYDHACPPGENALCVSFGDDEDNFCMNYCKVDSDCSSGLKCTPLTAAPDVTVCFLDI